MRRGVVGVQRGEQARAAGARLYPDAAVERIRQGGAKAAFAKAGCAKLPGGSYRTVWWIYNNAHGAFAARGVHGQTIMLIRRTKW
jgi:hypothetical protein